METLDDKLGESQIIRGANDLIDWIIRNNVMDVPFSGSRFTWSNKCLGDYLILERLDRVYVTPTWYEEYGRIKNEPITVSDHTTICYDSSLNILYSKRPYQIESLCLQFPEIQTLINETWNLNVGGSSMFKVHKICKILELNSEIDVSQTRNFGVNWKEETSSLLQQADDITNLMQGNVYIDKINEWLPIYSLRFQYWQ